MNDQRFKCALCKKLLTPETTFHGFGICIKREVKRPRNLIWPIIKVQHAKVCVKCHPKAKKINEAAGIFIGFNDYDS